MALKSKFGKGELPDGVVQVSEEEALNYQKSLVVNWPSEAEVLCLKFGSTITGAVSVLTSFMITNHFRVACRSDFKILAFTVIPAFAVPFYFTKYFTEKNVTEKILLMKVQCPLCITAKFAAQQFYSSLLFPSVYSFTTYSMYAEIKRTYTFPNMRTDAKNYWKEVSRLFKSGAKTFQIVGLVHTVIILFLPYWQHQELLKIAKKSEEEKDPELLFS